MDDFVALRELAADTRPLTDAARRAARDRLDRAMAGEDGSAVAPGLPRRRLIRFAVAATVAAGAGGTAVVASTRGGSPHARPIHAADVVEVLHHAASRSRADSKRLPIPRDDQYFYMKTFTEHTAVKDGKKQTWTDESWMSVDGSKPSRREEFGKVHMDPPLGKHEVASPPTRYSELKKWPTDPDKLLTWLGYGQKVLQPDNATPKMDSGSIAYFQAWLLLKGPRVLPPGLQAATFEALAKLPRIRIGHDTVDVLGRHGISVSYPGRSASIILDSSTYGYLGARDVGIHRVRVNGHWKWEPYYTSMTAREALGVVDRIGQRP